MINHEWLARQSQDSYFLKQRDYGKDATELQCKSKKSAQCAVKGNHLVHGQCSVGVKKRNYMCQVQGGRQNKAHQSKFYKAQHLCQKVLQYFIV